MATYIQTPAQCHAIFLLAGFIQLLETQDLKYEVDDEAQNKEIYERGKKVTYPEDPDRVVA